MDGKVTKTVLLVLIVACTINAIPTSKREIDGDSTTISTTSISTSPDQVTSSTSRPVEHRVEDIVIHAHEDDEIVSSRKGAGDQPVYEREVDEYIVEPVGDEYVLMPADDIMDVAASGLVFRPLFRYRQQSRRRVDRNTRRRYGQPRPYYRNY